jgi:hypothetical protein
MKRHLLALAFLGFLTPGAAQAYDGWINGRLLFYDTRSYTAAPGDGPYTDAMKNTWRPIAHVQVYAVVSGTSTVIGQSATDADGNFWIYWSSPIYDPSVSVNFYFESAFTQAGQPRFRIATADGGRWVSWTWPTTAYTYGITWLGDLYYGSEAAPHKLATMFATATDFWLSAGQYSTNLVNRLYGVQVRFPVPTSPTGRTVSRTQVEMADNWVVFNNSTLAHEFGHVVHQIEFEQDGTWGDCTWAGDGHSWDSVEWEGCASQEGFANFVAAATFFYPWAASPTAYGFDIETGCSGSNQWSESNHARLYWDLYDSNNETYDGASLPFYWFVDKLNIFPDGTANRQDRELDSNLNGRNAWDFYWHALYSGNGTNVDILYPLWMNCLYDAEW